MDGNHGCVDPTSGLRHYFKKVPEKNSILGAKTKDRAGEEKHPADLDKNQLLKYQILCTSRESIFITIFLSFGE